LSIVYSYATSQIPSHVIGDPLGAKVFPYLLSIALIAAALLLLFETYRTKRQEASKTDEESRKEKRHLAVVGAVVSWTILFVVLLEPLGFLLSTSLYLVVFMTCLNSKQKLLRNIVVSAVFSAAFYMLLVKGLGVTLAKGILHF
jgi:putative tricarboxylic transport membrane protein